MRESSVIFYELCHRAQGPWSQEAIPGEWEGKSSINAITGDQPTTWTNFILEFSKQFIHQLQEIKSISSMKSLHVRELGN